MSGRSKESRFAGWNNRREHTNNDEQTTNRIVNASIWNFVDKYNLFDQYPYLVNESYTRRKSNTCQTRTRAVSTKHRTSTDLKDEILKHTQKSNRNQIEKWNI